MSFPARRRDRPSESQASPRAVWYDRNPVQASVGWAANDVAAHAFTVRASYTVPTGKKAFIGAAQALVTRKTAATAVGKATIDLNQSGVGSIEAAVLNNTVGAQDNVIVHFGNVFPAGTLIRIASADPSTGGTVDYNAQFFITEFDA